MFEGTGEISSATKEECVAQWKATCMAWCREGRDARIAATDYIHFPDATVSEDYKAQLIVYRQQLRDFPAEFSALFDGMTDEEQLSITRQSIPYPAKP